MSRSLGNRATARRPRVPIGRKSNFDNDGAQDVYIKLGGAYLGDTAHSVLFENPAAAATYALFSLLPGVSPGNRIVISAGIDTYGTSAAIDLATSPDGVRELMRRLDPGRGEKLPDYFQAVIRTELIRGEPVAPRLVLVRQSICTTRWAFSRNSPSRAKHERTAGAFVAD